ncbi:hypothetical protein FQN50_003424 [Emmonsiellopsis sp. PD_5]|nr:hypothetical protein FQN50_003424 [Emmonsiellopsis sp. PD_5]
MNNIPGIPAGKPPAPPGGEDIVDKGLKKVEQKLTKGKGDPNKTGGLREKATDKAREAVEKATGKKIPEKISR